MAITNTQRAISPIRYQTRSGHAVIAIYWFRLRRLRGVYPRRRVSPFVASNHQSDDRRHVLATSGENPICIWQHLGQILLKSCFFGRISSLSCRLGGNFHAQTESRVAACRFARLVVLRDGSQEAASSQSAGAGCGQAEGHCSRSSRCSSACEEDASSSDAADAIRADRRDSLRR